MTVLNKIILKDIMVKDPRYIEINETLSKAWDMFRAFDIRHLPVVDSKKILKGIITERDLFRIASPRKADDGEYVYYNRSELDNYILAQMMTKDVYSLHQDDSLGKAIDLMMSHKYGCIPVVDDKKRLQGIITLIDVLKAVREYFV